MTRAVAWLAALALTACAPPPTMAEYCEHTGLCVCADGACCSVGGQACSEDVPCCAGMECSPDAVCVLEGPVPQLELSPTAIDFGWVDADAAPEVRTIHIRNSGTTATRPLELVFLPETRTEPSFLLDDAGCARAELQAGDACDVRVTFVPEGGVSRMRQTTLQLREAPEGLPARALGQVALAAEAGHDLTVRVNGAAVVLVEAPPQIPVTSVVPNQPLTLWQLRTWVATLDAPGHHPIHFSAGTPTQFPITVEVTGHVDVTIEAEPNVHFTADVGPKGRAAYVNLDVYQWFDGAAGGWGWRGRCAEGLATCKFAVEGKVMLRALAPGVYQGPYLWGGACDGTTGPECVLASVTGRTDVTLQTD